MKSHSSSSHHSIILSLSAVLLCASSSNSFAATSFFNRGADSIDRLREAIEQVQTSSSVRQLLRESPESSLSLSQRVGGKLMETTKFQHFYKGLEVVGSMAFHHRTAQGVQVDDQVARFDLDTQPNVSLSDAMGIAQSITGNRELEAKPVLKILPLGEGDSARLVYFIDVQAQGLTAGRQILVDAHSGSVIADLSKHEELAPIEVYSTHGAEQNSECQTLDAKGRPVQLNPLSCVHVVLNSTPSDKADEAARRAAQNSAAVLEYYQSHHSRNSYDDQGSSLVNLVHAGQAFDNAFWDSSQNIMAYGDGDGTTFGNFTRALDVAGHECTHGVTAQTAQLLYMGESGALNEAYSDFFGKLIGGVGDWAIGKDLYLDAENAKGVRNLANPGNLSYHIKTQTGHVYEGAYPSTVGEMAEPQESCGRDNDNCFVHINSTVPSHASYLIYQALGQEKAENLYYVTLTQKLTSRATFKSAAAATYSVCKQLYDGGTCNAVKQAFEKVGLSVARSRALPELDAILDEAGIAPVATPLTAIDSAL